MKTKKKRHTGTFIAEQFDIVINEVGVDKVAAVRCFAHNINLLVKNIIGIPWCASIITSVKEIVKFFKNHHVESACLIIVFEEPVQRSLEQSLASKLVDTTTF
ncbi:uncharacterized protein LOC111693179 [Rhizophagus irregularis DAOM 181602=DAOM 197198]|nr:uncharacterized protein LOC111693179 [Rhizophagus irregularis DAOM 181602=DAOM 197198]